MQRGLTSILHPKGSFEVAFRGFEEELQHVFSPQCVLQVDVLSYEMCAALCGGP